jgi:hypothetical protein
VSVIVYFVSEGQITQPLVVIGGQVVAKRSVHLLFSGEPDSGHCDAVLPVERKEEKFQQALC